MRKALTCGTGVSPVKEESPHGQDAHATYLHRNGSIAKRRGAYLPHWTQDGATYFVTFRLADSLPQAVVASWKREREQMAKAARCQNRPLSLDEQTRLEKLFSQRVERWLDAGRGACWMKRDSIAAVVASALSHSDGLRHRLWAWCVMPNHVHVVVQPLAERSLPRILHTWKSFSSKETNRLLEQRGTFWQPEYFDHLIRGSRDFLQCVQYTLRNPAAAGLRNLKWVGTYGMGLCGTGVPPVKEESPHGQDAHAAAAVMPKGDMRT